MPVEPPLNIFHADSFDVKKLRSDRLFHYIEKRDLDGIKQVIAEGINANGAHNNSTPLIKALELPEFEQKAEIISYLLEHGAQPNQPNRAFSEGDGPPSPTTYPLFIAAKNDRAIYTKILLEHGADPYLIRPDTDATVLNWTLVAENTGTMQTIIEAAKKNGTPEKYSEWLNKRNENGYNILHSTVSMFNTDVADKSYKASNKLTNERIKILIKNGADPCCPALGVILDNNDNIIQIKEVFILDMIDIMKQKTLDDAQNFNPGTKEIRLNNQGMKKLMLIEDFKRQTLDTIKEVMPRFSLLPPKEEAEQTDLSSNMLKVPNLLNDTKAAFRMASNLPLR